MNSYSELKSLPPVIVVDAYSAGALIAAELSKHRRIIHVQSDPDINLAYVRKLPFELFDVHVRFVDRDLKRLVDILTPMGPCAVIAGSEWGVYLAERLAQALGLQSNNAHSSSLRRDKFAMTSRVNQYGLAVAKQICSDDLSLLLAWYQKHSQTRVVVKPIDSAGSEDVFICDNQDSLANAIKTIIGKSNLIGGLNSKVLLQEYLSGTEYVINTVAYQGKQWFTDVWKVTKHLNAAGRNLYDYDELCNPEDPAVLACIDYVEHCLNALELTFGPGHTEVILTENGPHLLETAARISGAANPKLIGDATGTDQVRLSAICCIAPEKLKSYPTHYKRKMYARSVHLQVRNPHVFSHDKVRRFLNTLPSFSNVIFRAQDNSMVEITCDVSTCPAAFFLGHQDETQIEQDYQDFRAWEFKNL